jgi:penicillin amidase
VGTDQADVYVETLHPDGRDAALFRGRWEPLRTVPDTIRVLGRPPVVLTHKYTRHGPVFHLDSAARRAWVIRSTMHEPGSAGYLSALRYHAIGDCRGFLAAQRWYLAPTENMICGDRDGNLAWQASAASPRRPNWHGRLPVPGDGRYEWTGFRDDLPRELNPARGWIATANHDIHPPGYDPPLFFKAGPQTARYDRIVELLAGKTGFTVTDLARMQHDAFNAAAFRDLERFRGWTASDPALERARALLAGWDGWQRKESAAAALWSFVPRTGPVEEALRRGLAELVAAQGADPAGWRWGRVHRSELPHPLVAAYDIPAVERSGGSGTVAATGATYRQVVDFGDLDASLATNFPGQSGQPGGPFYANLAEPYGRGEYFPLSYTRAAVERHAAHRLWLVPAQP